MADYNEREREAYYQDRRMEHDYLEQQAAKAFAEEDAKVDPTALRTEAERLDEWLREGGNADVADLLQRMSGALLAAEQERDRRPTRAEYDAVCDALHRTRMENLAAIEEQERLKAELAHWKEIAVQAGQIEIQARNQRDDMAVQLAAHEGAIRALQAGIEELAHEWDGRAFHSNQRNNYATELRAKVAALLSPSGPPQTP